jgi:hypothetical protein
VIAFIVPVHSRYQIADACLRQLARVCALHGAATAFIIGDDPFFETLADELGFHWVRSSNHPLGRKWNDGFEAASNAGADHLVPFGSDDVIDLNLLLEPMPSGRQIRCCRQTAVVSPDGRQIAELAVNYPGGDGVRIWTRETLEQVGFRPANDRRDRGIDGSMNDHLLAVTGRRPEYVYADLHPLQVIDFKTDTPDQRTSFRACASGEDRRVPVLDVRGDFWDEVAEIHSAEFVDRARAVYSAPVAA